MKTWQKLITILAVFAAAYFTPFEKAEIQKAIMSAFFMMQDYAQKHVILCLVPAFFIAGGLSVFLSQSTVIKYLGAEAKKITAYSVASVSGSVLAVCSCTVLPLFAGIYRMGAGLGPACAFLYSGPAINVLAIVLTSKILGWQIGLARAIGAVSFAFIIGLLMAFTFPEKKDEKNKNKMVLPEEENSRSLLQELLFFLPMIGILVFANWAKPDTSSGLWHTIHAAKWYLASAFGILFSISLVKWYSFKLSYTLFTIAATAASAFLFPQLILLTFSVAVLGLILSGLFSSDESKNWIDSSKTFAFQILPLLFGGILIAGFLLGMPGEDSGIIPTRWISSLVGGNSIAANFFASIAGAFMYFATLTEVPIIQGLLGSGMGKGPALALLLSGPALSLPNMLVIRSVLGTQKTIVFVFYVVLLSTIVGKLFGHIIL